MLAFMTYIEKDGNYIAGYLGTDDDLMPVDFFHTEPIKPLTRLEKILHGKQFEVKLFGYLLGGTLFKNLEESKGSEIKQIEANFVSDARMLHLRKKTGDIPVAYVSDDGEIVTHENYAEDSQSAKRWQA
jgi:hypothetical protein